jgi:uncharacterized protein (TIGR03083 family)
MVGTWRSEPVDYGDALAAFDAAYHAVDELAGQLSPTDLLAFSRCRGWVVADVLFHLLGDAQRALVALASPASGPPDRDFVSYWAEFGAQNGDWVPGAWSVRRSAAAYREGAGTVALWRETAPAAVRAAGRADPHGCVMTQGHTLTVPDLLATLATEAVVHHLDMTVNLGAAPGPRGVAVALAARTLDGLLNLEHRHSRAQYPGGWTAEEYLLKGSGRLPLTPADRIALGSLAARFPLIG